jgi:hypothetical protein
MHMPNKKVKARNVLIFLKFGSNLNNFKNYIVFKILNKKFSIFLRTSINLWNKANSNNRNNRSKMKILLQLFLKFIKLHIVVNFDFTFFYIDVYIHTK